MTEDKIISIESDEGPFKMVLRNVMRMVPDRDKQDVALQRMLAFRLRIDGESAVREYLMHKIRDMIQCAYTGRLYDFLKNDQASHTCGSEPPTFDPPESA